MSKHKHFHSIKSGYQMLQHGRREGIGPFRAQPRSKKETAADAANIDGGKVERDLRDRFSASSLTETKEDCKHEEE